MVRKPYLMRVSSMLAQIFQVKPYFSLIFANFCCCHFIIVLKNSFPVFDTLIKTLAMLREHLRSCKPLRFASWFAYSLSTSRVFGSEYWTRKTGFYCLIFILLYSFLFVLVRHCDLVEFILKWTYTLMWNFDIVYWYLEVIKRWTFFIH